MEGSKFFSEVGELIGHKAHIRMMSEVDQQTARNRKFVDPLRDLLGDEMSDMVSEMLDTAFVAGFVRGNRFIKGENHEG